MKKIKLLNKKNSEDKKNLKLKANIYPHHPLFDKHGAVSF